MLRGEGSMRLLGVLAYSDDLSTEVLEFLIGLPKLARLCSASIREIFRIKVYNYVLLPPKSSRLTYSPMLVRSRNPGTRPPSPIVAYSS